MLDGLIGYKLGMTQVFSDEGKLVPVTLLELGPCKVVQVKTVEKDGYQAVQLSFDDVKAHRVAKPLLGHYKKAALSPARFLREFKAENAELSVGGVINSEIFKKGEFVDVSGVSRGKGFQGVMRRHNFGGGPASHGSHFHRAPGSVGNSATPSRVWKNKALPGQMGNKLVTTQNLEVIEVRPDQNIVMIKGAIPGGTKGLVVVRKSVKKQVQM